LLLLAQPNRFDIRTAEAAQISDATLVKVSPTQAPAQIA